MLGSDARVVCLHATPAPMPPHTQLPALTKLSRQNKMAPRSKAANISFTVESASEDEMTVDELNAHPTPESNSENKAPSRSTRGAAQTKKTASATKATAKGRSSTR